MKRSTGYIYRDGKSYVARVTYRDEFGKRRNVKRKCRSKTEATVIKEQLLRSINDHGIVESAKLTFATLAREYADARLQPPVYENGIKISGLRSLSPVKGYVTTLVEHFGSRRLKSLNHLDLESYRAKRLATPTRHGKKRSVTAVNRELEVFRTMLNYAIRKGYIAVNPFSRGAKVIIKAAEVKRKFLIDTNQEEDLLAACSGPRAHIRPLVMAAMDTGLRRNELLTLLWSDVDLIAKTLTVRAINAKTNKARLGGISDRLLPELIKLPRRSESDRVFGIEQGFKRAWTTARRLAGLQELRFHDLRHVFVSRTNEAGVPLEQSRVVSGHDSTESAKIYNNANLETVHAVRAALNRLHQERKRDSVPAETIN